MTPCQVCGAPMVEEKEETALSTAMRWVCSAWKVHPRWIFGRRPADGAPAEGVPR